MRYIFLWIFGLLYLYMSFYYSPLAEKFEGISSRALFFHVPAAWVSLLAFCMAAYFSIRYLTSRNYKFDLKAVLSVELGFLFCVLATITGSLWAKVMWGSYWNWDPRQTSIIAVLIFYVAYLVLRDSVEDKKIKPVVAAAYASLGFIVAPFFYFVIPRITYSLHPDPVVNTEAKLKMDSKIFITLIVSTLFFTLLYLVMLRLVERVELLKRKAK